MDRAWKFMERAFSSARARALVIMAIVGLGCCRACLGWILDLGRHNSIANPQLLDFHLLIDIGEVMGFVACALYVRRKGPLIKMGFPILLSLLCFAVSAILIAAIPIGQATSPIRLLAMGTASIGCGFGYACLFVFWLELCGCMQPSRAIFAIGGSYAVSFLAWALLDGMDLPHRCVLTIAFFLASALLLIASTIRTDQSKLPLLRPIRSMMSWRVVLWVAIMAFAYGFGDGFTNMGFSTLASKVGMIIPILIIAAGLAMFPSKFDMVIIYRLTFPLMALGLSITVLLSALPELAQALMSAAQANYIMLACAIACLAAYRTKSSAAFACGLLLAANAACAQIGKLLGLQLGAANLSPTIGLVAVLLLAATGTLLLREQDFSSLVKSVQSAPVREQSLRHAAKERGLSQRELSVFLLLVEGKETTEIGSELFIAQSTVRAHISRIYEKLGVHSRQELRQLAEGMVDMRAEP